MVSGDASLEQFVLPIHIHSTIFAPILLIRTILELVGILTEFGELFCVHHRITVEESLGTDVTIISYSRALLLITFISSDDDDTVGTTRTVDSGSRGIFQDVHVLDVVRIDVADATCERNTVEYDQWVIAGCQGTCTTDTNLHGCTWL